jgi:hypothetical protein
MAEPLQITVQGTPNPNAAKFTLNRLVAAQGTTYRATAGAEAASPGSPGAGQAAAEQPAWVRQALAIPGVIQLFTLQQFISVTKAPEAEWGAIIPAVERVLQQAFAEGG